MPGRSDDTSDRGDPVQAYRVVLSELLRKRQELDSAISAIQQMIGMDDLQQAPPPVVAEAAGRPARHVRVAEAVRATLERLGRPARNAEIKAALIESGYRFTAGDPDVSIVQALNRLTALKLVVKVGRGLWALRGVELQ